ncbi:unnamed protein product, partial [Allacma fusca]
GGDSVNARLWGHVKEPPVSLVTTQTLLDREQLCARLTVNDQKEITLSPDSCYKKLFFVCRERLKKRSSALNFSRNMTKGESDVCYQTSFLRLKKHGEFLSKTKLPWIAAYKCCEFWKLNLLPSILYEERDLYTDNIDHAWIGGKDFNKKKSVWEWLGDIRVDPRLWGDDSSHRLNELEKCTLLRHSNGHVGLLDYNCKVSNHFICQGQSERWTRRSP